VAVSSGSFEKTLTIRPREGSFDFGGAILRHLRSGWHSGGGDLRCPIRSY
jgi:hypothetical protein